MGDASKNVRLVAADVVLQVSAKGKSLNAALANASDQVAAKDTGLLQELSYGVCRHWFSLSAIQSACLNQPLKSKDAAISCLINVGLYQILHTRIPAHAAVFETVEAAKKLRRGKVTFNKLVNAVLQRALREEYSAESTDCSTWDHPQWIIEKLKHNWPHDWQNILQQNNTAPPMSLRVNVRQTNREAYLECLQQNDISATPCQHARHGITLDTPSPVMALPAFDTGAASVQDEAAQLCSQLLNLKGGLKVLDACAAPGGKTCSILENSAVQLLALDCDEERVKSIKENLSRLELKADLKTTRAEEIESWWDGETFDRILLDAPCSASGVIRRHPDIKLLRKESDITPLANLQLKLLQNLWTTLKPTGFLLYATCSVFPQENDRIIERFLKTEDSATIADIDANWGTPTKYGRQLFPTAGGHDGFYYARLQKQH